MVVIVTGGAGFIGSHLVGKLLDKGCEVTVIDSLWTGSAENIKKFEANERFKLIRQDVRDPAPEVAGVTEIYHLACPASPDLFEERSIEILETCFQGAKNMLDPAVRSKARILIASTSEIYGDPIVIPQTEDYWGNTNSFGPRSCYDEGKRITEALAYAYQRRHGLEVRIARIFNAYGPSMQIDDGRAVPNFIAAAMQGRPIVIYGDGSATRCFQFGSPTAAIIANRCPHIQVTVVDRDTGSINAWQSDALPISEKGLLEIVQEARDGAGKSRRPNLFFTIQLECSVQQAKVIMEVVRAIAEHAKSNKIVVEKSTIPIGTGETVRGILNANARNGVAFEVLSNPEFLAEGIIVADLLCPDRILIESLDISSGYTVAKTLADIYASWLPRSRIIIMDLFLSKLSELAANAILAQRISNMNALGVICETTGARVEEIAQAVSSDTTIGPHMLNSPFGFGGSYFKKDIRSLVYICQYLDLDGVAAYWDAILDINEHQKSRTITRMASKLQDGLRQKRVAVLGFAFKPGTGDTRESCAIDLVRGLLRQGASVTIYDPCVIDNQIYQDLGLDAHNPNLSICNSGEEAYEGAHAILVATNWEMFSTKRGKNPKQTTYDNVNFT
ncbi:putative UDP-glucose 6-dehydrogenase [Seiridium cardinale]|uniref:UDP-glucose 6-dehydrogenase n=1 Tax=Seiridium cardinale TaxID=138064 RepID=A0ABR2XKR2_9PEZI